MNVNRVWPDGERPQVLLESQARKTFDRVCEGSTITTFVLTKGCK